MGCLPQILLGPFLNNLSRFIIYKILAICVVRKSRMFLEFLIMDWKTEGMPKIESSIEVKDKTVFEK